MPKNDLKHQQLMQALGIEVLTKGKDADKKVTVFLEYLYEAQYSEAILHACEHATIFDGFFMHLIELFFAHVVEEVPEELQTIVFKNKLLELLQGTSNYKLLYELLGIGVLNDKEVIDLSTPMITKANQQIRTLVRGSDKEFMELQEKYKCISLPLFNKNIKDKDKLEFIIAALSFIREYRDLSTKELLLDMPSCSASLEELIKQRWKNISNLRFNKLFEQIIFTIKSLSKEFKTRHHLLGRDCFSDFRLDQYHRLLLTPAKGGKQLNPTLAQLKDIVPLTLFMEFSDRDKIIHAGLAVVYAPGQDIDKLYGLFSDIGLSKAAGVDEDLDRGDYLTNIEVIRRVTLEKDALQDLLYLLIDLEATQQNRALESTTLQRILYCMNIVLSTENRHIPESQFFFDPNFSSELYPMREFFKQPEKYRHALNNFLADDVQRNKIKSEVKSMFAGFLKSLNAHYLVPDARCYVGTAHTYFERKKNELLSQRVSRIVVNHDSVESGKSVEITRMVDYIRHNARIQEVNVKECVEEMIGARESILSALKQFSYKMPGPGVSFADKLQHQIDASSNEQLLLECGPLKHVIVYHIQHLLYLIRFLQIHYNVTIFDKIESKTLITNLMYFDHYFQEMLFLNHPSLIQSGTPLVSQTSMLCMVVDLICTEDFRILCDRCLKLAHPETQSASYPSSDVSSCSAFSRGMR